MLVHTPVVTKKVEFRNQVYGRYGRCHAQTSTLLKDLAKKALNQHNNSKNQKIIKNLITGLNQTKGRPIRYGDVIFIQGQNFGKEMGLLDTCGDAVVWVHGRSP